MIRLCIIGCGAVVEASHARVLPTLRDRIRVTACYDVERARAQSMAARLGARRAAHVDAIGDDAALWDAALIATPPAHHAPLAHALIAAGKHVLIEKPFVMRARDASVLIQEAERAGTRLLVGHFRRYYPSLQAARHAIAVGVLGGIDRVEVWEGGRWDWPARSSYAFTSPDGGVVLDAGSHALDTALFVLGIDDGINNLRIDAIRKQPQDEPSQDVDVTGRLEAAGLSGLPLRLRLTRLEPIATAIKIRGADGRWLVVPAAHAATASLIERDGAARPVEAPTDARYRPPDALSAFYCEYLDLLRSIDDPAYTSMIDARRFVGLAGVLDGITGLGRDA